jgi:hypothetical protein
MITYRYHIRVERRQLIRRFGIGDMFFDSRPSTHFVCYVYLIPQNRPLRAFCDMMALLYSVLYSNLVSGTVTVCDYSNVVM